MHDDQPRDDLMHDDAERLVQPRQSSGGKGARTAGGFLVALGALALKFKAVLLGFSSLKWLVFAPKLAISFGSMFISIYFYALFFGWKFGIVLVAMLAVHEFGHYVTFRNLGIRASLPTFIPGFGAFVSSPMSADPAQNAFAAIMGPVFGIAAAAICWGFGLSNGENFWIAAAYFGFFINLINLIPALPLDGGRVAGAIDGRVWLIGAVLVVALLVVWQPRSIFTWVIVILVLMSSVPRGIAAFRGHVDPTVQIVSGRQRAILAVAYFALLGIAGLCAAATKLDPSQLSLHA
ncbi:MAG TPA: site-2 protease family protein [Candidatus Elarobacter sp.]|nr:site-2 protease family protein [Candidatus Elarobacter sp.]